MATLNTPTFDINAFDYDKAKRLLTAEASCLTEGSKRRLFGQAYDDACDEGLTVKGQLHLIRFAVSKTDADGEDIYGWHLEPISEFVGGRWGSVPAEHKDLRILVIND